MAVLVDPAVWPWKGRRWAHMVSDVSYEELHRFAELLGVPRRAFQGDHYDIPEELRRRAVELGAVSVGSRVLLRRLKGAGLRLPPAQRRQLPRQVGPGQVFQSGERLGGDVQPGAV